MVRFVKCKCIANVDNDERITVGNEYWTDPSSHVRMPLNKKFMSLYSDADIFTFIGCFDVRCIELLEEEAYYDNHNR